MFSGDEQHYVYPNGDEVYNVSIVYVARYPGGEVLIDARDIKDRLGHGLDLILDGGYKPSEPSSVIDLTGPEPVVVRQGKGDVTDLVEG